MQAKQAVLLFRCQAERMISDVKAAFISNLHKLKWMDDATRAAAIEKVSQVFKK